MSSTGVLAVGWRPLSRSSRLSVHCASLPLTLRNYITCSHSNPLSHSICLNKERGSEIANKQCQRTIFHLSNNNTCVNKQTTARNILNTKQRYLHISQRNSNDRMNRAKRRVNPHASHTFMLFIRNNTSLLQSLNQEEHISNNNNNNNNDNINNNPSSNSENDANSTTRRAPPAKYKLYMKLGKAQLTFGTAVMSGAGYLAVGRFSLLEFTSVFFGTWILGMSGGSANQIIERDLDRQMARTKSRPLPSGQISLRDAYLFSAGTGALGMGLLLGGANPLAASVGAATWAAYIVYTYSKTRTVYNTHIGAVSGALPLVIGWTGAGGLLLDFQCLSEFAAMWFWQFAHFNVISWQYRQDYYRAGFKMQSGIDMAKERGRRAVGGRYAFAGSFFFAVVPVVSIMHGYNSPLFLGSYAATLPFVWQMAQFWKDPVHARPVKFGGRSFSPLAVGGMTLLVYLIFFALSSTRWGEDGTKDFFGYSLVNFMPRSLAGLFSRHCPVRFAMDNNRIAASHSPTGLDPQFHSQEEMWRVFHGMSLLCPTYYSLPKKTPKISELIE